LKKSPFETWEQYNNSANIKFHLHRKREIQSARKYVKLGDDIIHYTPNNMPFNNFLRPEIIMENKGKDKTIKTLLEQKTRNRLSRLSYEFQETQSPILVSKSSYQPLQVDNPPENIDNKKKKKINRKIRG